ncbi:T9SS type A sorting domain-containing protein [Rufibacter quisquiliarum]|uniref:Secretion system C-terminal sorting domain-containing protein n=1 Tax=Rufibacter quisquiliarum TaxID=1549639 RepID=A0A839GIA8_9BACT|nr:T9SS type A sorting domain-containing protein [Rufibacter quisquiliarum]MBA9078360.1 hypothetical protein [Rufibacter quisquiliarum]
MIRALKVLAFFISYIALAPSIAWAQASVRLQEVTGPAVQKQGSSLPLPWAGGMNSPQFSHIDLNLDGQPDLFVFDRSSQRVSTFLAVQAGGQWRYQFAPQYAAAFPRDLIYFALLRDFNCDGAPDLFTATNAGIKLYTNTSAQHGKLTFSLTHPLLLYNRDGNIVVGAEDMPAIVDMDGDGDLDILTWEWSGGRTLEYYQNQRVEQNLGCAEITFTKVTNRWGNLTRCAGSCNSYRFGGESCPSSHHVGGSSVLPLDVDGNGVLDLLAGHDDCADLVTLLNTGTNLLPKLSSADYNLPPDITGNQFSVFPAAYYLDVTFDGVPDLVVAPNATSNSHQNVDLKNSVWVYANTGTAQAPRFQAPKQPFLQNQMIDVGEGAAPALADLTGDGVLDLLIGNTAVLENGRYAATLTFYKNKGTRQQPVFEEEAIDYLSFSVLGQQALKPQLLDLNKDGAVDLVWSIYNNTTSRVELKYLLNQAAAGQPAQFSRQQEGTITGVLFFRGDSPYLTDVNQDGTVDLLIGRASGALHYYRNTGSNTAPAWSLVTEALGGLDGSSVYGRLQVQVADLNKDGKADLLTSDDSGEVKVYPDFAAHLAGAFPVEANVLWQPALQQYQPAIFGAGAAVAVGDLDQNSDQLPEVLIGTRAGGLRFLKVIKEPLGLGEEPPALAGLKLFPNPARGFTQLLTPQAATYVLYNVAGQNILAGKTSADQLHQISTAATPAGLYLLKVVLADGKTITHKLLVQP